MIPQGTYKLVWFVDPDHPESSDIGSKLYPTKKAALKASPLYSGDWLLMRLELQNPDPDLTYFWKVLPYGSYKKYHKGLKLSKRFSNAGGEEAKETDVSHPDRYVQFVRLVDVFFIAPVLVYTGTRKELPMWLRLSLIGVGTATFFYNGYTYLKCRTKS